MIEQQSNHRLEALKLAFDVALRTEILNKRQVAEDFNETLVSVFKLAELNFKYSTEGKILEKEDLFNLD